MSGRSSYRLRDSNLSRAPVRYREYEVEQEADARNRSIRPRGRQSNELHSQKIETIASSHSAYHPHHSSTRVYATGTGAGGMEPELQYEGMDQSANMINDELTMLAENTTPYSSQPSVQQNSQHYGFPHNAELSISLRNNLRNLKNVLKLPKARRFVFCEFFYSAVDKQLFLEEENEFLQLMQDSFPNLKTTKLRLPEWREVRRLIGKPRRLSQLFLKEETDSLDYKRKKIREIYNGSCMTLPMDCDLPKKLPRQLSVGMKIYARIREPKDGIYAGTIDAVSEDGYRVMFEKEEMINSRPVADSEIMCETPLELYSISYFIEMNNANNKSSLMSNTMFPKPAFVVDPRRAQVVNMTNTPNQPPSFAFQSRGVSLKDEKIGNFPLRMLVIMVKLFKVLEHKKVLLQNLTWLNDEGERMQLLTRVYPTIFQERYAEILRELESINRLLESYMNGIEEYNDILIQNLSDPRPLDRPEQLRKSTAANANQIVKHCNSSLNVKSKEALSLISKLTTVMLQIRKLGVERKHHIHFELSILAESLNQIKYELAPSNVGYFQDCVEVHMKQIFLMMNKAKTL